jgi:Fe/S biogenesis protein NfuA
VPDETDILMSAEPRTTQELLHISEPARERLVALRFQDPEAERLALWLAVAGVQNGRYTYEMTFRYRSDVRPGDVVQDFEDLTVAVPRESADRLRGARIDVEAGALNIDNPNRPSAVGMMLPVVPKAAPGGDGQPGGGHAGHAHGGHEGHGAHEGHAHAAHAPAETVSPAVGAQVPGDLSGPVADRVARVLDESINPAIAAHGGHAELVSVDAGTAYLRLSGGCQGCGMATVTLTQGIRSALLQAVPEIGSVVDVTDHAAGTDPYFAPDGK